MTTYDLYDDFAYFYNKYWTISTPLLMDKALNMIMYPYIDDGSSILDLCCGTGNFANILHNYGYNVTGVDGSIAMLAYAKINAPNVNFIHQDIRNLDIDKKYKAVTCLFDSINHLLEPEEVLKAFGNVYNLLENRGVFIFDINSDIASIEDNQREFSAVDTNDVCIFNTNHDKKNNISIFSLTTFLLDNGVWNRADFTIYEKFYSQQDIMTMLHASGFNNIGIYDGYSDLGIESFEGRTFFSAYK